MEIKNRYVQAYLFLWIMGMCMYAHPLKCQSVIPAPLKMERGTGSFPLSGGVRLYTGFAEEDAALLRNSLKALPVDWKQARKNGGRNILSIEPAEGDPSLSSSESYTLSVSPERIKIRAASGAGAFYAVQTLLQLAQPLPEGGYAVPSVEIEDAPRFAYRGFMLDVSRHFFTKEFVKKQIDALAFYKINRLHLHLTDAAGWRIEIKKYPLLTERAAWRTEANWKKWWNGDRRYARFDDPGAYGGFYTQQDIREIVEYARRHHVTVIPEIEMPGHSEEVLAVYPQLSCAGEPYKNADFCVGNEETFTFLEDVLKEVMELFPSEYIHVGGDEAGKAAWRTCPKCSRRMEEEHLSHVDELQSYLIRRIEKFLHANGRKLLGWDEILEGGPAPRSTVMSWRGEKGGLEAVRAGHDAVMSPGAYCYFDSYQDAPYSQPEAIGGYLPLKKVYAYRPVPDDLPAGQAQRIRGVQANLWTEYIATPEHAEYMIYPRILALSEVAWSAPENRAWEDFHKRVPKAVAHLKSKGYHPFDPAGEVGSRPESGEAVDHLALGKKVTYHAPYSTAYPAQGESALTDGIRGDWTYGDGAWQGFISRHGLDVTVDLGKETEVRSISADFMQVAGAEVFLPGEVSVSISSDGSVFVPLHVQRNETDKEKAIGFRTVGWEGTAKGRYVRYTARPGKKYGGWVFTDEIVIK